MLVDQLEAAGYLQRRPDPTDGRARLVTLGARGLAALPCAREAQERVEQEWRYRLGARGYERLETALRSLREVTDPWA